MQNEFTPIAQRINNAQQHFVNLCIDRGFTNDEASKIFAVYKKARAIKLNATMGRYDITHGTYMEIEVMRRALEL